MALLNVRLDAEDARRVADLKRAGVQLSGVVRQAIRSEHQRRLGNQQVRGKAGAIMADIYAACPDPKGTAARAYDIHESMQARRAITKKLRTRRR